MSKVRESQVRASRSWESKNKSQATIASYKRTSRSFINNHAELDDLEELEKLIKQKKEMSEMNKVEMIKESIIDVVELIDDRFEEAVISQVFRNMEEAKVADYSGRLASSIDDMKVIETKGLEVITAKQNAHDWFDTTNKFRKSKSYRLVTLDWLKDAINDIDLIKVKGIGEVDKEDVLKAIK